MRCSLAISIFALIFPLLNLRAVGENIILPGDSTPLSRAIQESSDVVVGNLTARGGIDIGPIGTLDYFHSKVQVETILRGNAQGELVCSFRRRTYPVTVAEQEPMVGKQYIVFLKHGYKLEYTITKFVECSNDQLIALKKLIKENDETPSHQN